MLTEYPCKKVEEGVYEINEFDGVSMYVIEGNEKALLVDTGAGIGDLKTFAERLVKGKPIEVMITHNHRDHAGNAPLFKQIHMSAADADIGPIIRPWTSKASRLRFARRSLETFPDRSYPWSENDIREFAPDQEPEVKRTEDGHIFDLGGRQVRCVLVPGHTPGSMAYALTDASGQDCCGQNVGLGVRPLENPEMDHVSMEEARDGLIRLWSMDFDRKRIYSAHTDYRRFGHSLGEDIIPRDIRAMEMILAGRCRVETEEIPVLDLSVDHVVTEGISIQFHLDHLFRKRQV